MKLSKEGSKLSERYLLEVSKLRELRLVKASDRNLGLDEPEPEALGGVDR